MSLGLVLRHPGVRPGALSSLASITMHDVTARTSRSEQGRHVRNYSLCRTIVREMITQNEAKDCSRLISQRHGTMQAPMVCPREVSNQEPP